MSVKPNQLRKSKTFGSYVYTISVVDADDRSFDSIRELSEIDVEIWYCLILDSIFEESIGTFGYSIIDPKLKVFDD